MKALRINVACLVFGLLCACEPPPREAAVAVPPTALATSPTTPTATTLPTAAAVPATTTAQATVPSGTASASAQSTPPPLDDRCSKDSDCTLFIDDIADSATTTACCSGCSQRAANNDWLAAFRAHCQRNPPTMCPPLGCAMPLRRAVCKAGRCAMASL